jgi:hypothetical protein
MNWRRCAGVECGHIKTTTVDKVNKQKQKFYICGITGKALTSAVCPLSDDEMTRMIRNADDPKEVRRVILEVRI